MRKKDITSEQLIFLLSHVANIKWISGYLKKMDKMNDWYEFNAFDPFETV